MRYAVALFLTLAASAQTAIPDTRAGNAFHAWLDAFNSGDRARVVAYYDKYSRTRKIASIP